MTKIEEKRKLLEARIKEMAEDGVMKTPPKETLSYDSPDDEDDEKEEGSSEIGSYQQEQQLPMEDSFMEEKPISEEKIARRSNERSNDKAEADITSLDNYRTRYLQSVRIRERTAFTMNADTLQVLRNVLQDLGERVSMASYIDNILREHLKSHKELLNTATAKQRRKVAINF